MGVGSGLSAVGSGRGKAEYVVAHRTVNLEAVVAVVGACKRHTADFGRHGERHVLHDVVDVAVYGRCVLNLSQGEVLSGSGSSFGFSHNHYFVQQLRAGSQFHILCISVTQFKHDACKGGTLIAHVGHCKFVRAAGTHTLHRIASVHVGDSAILCTRRFMNSYNRRSDYSLILFVGHLAANGRGSDLRIYAHSRQDQHQRKNNSHSF